MKQVYVVFLNWYENTEDQTDAYNSEHVEYIFDSEDKAVNYIKEAFKEHHSWALTTYPDVKELKLYNSSTYNFQPGEPVRVLDIWKGYGFTLAIHYRYEVYSVG